MTFAWIASLVFGSGLLVGIGVGWAGLWLWQWRNAKWSCGNCGRRAYPPSRVELAHGTCRDCDEIAGLGHVWERSR